MAHFFTNAQIPGYSLIRGFSKVVLASLLIVGVFVCSKGQSTNPKANKFFDKAEQAIRSRDFNAGIGYYQKAVDKDPLFARAYLRLAMSYEVLREMDTSFYYYDQYCTIKGINNMSPAMGLKITELYLLKGRYGVADSLISQFVPSDKDTLKYESLKEQLDFINTSVLEGQDVDISWMSDSVNRFESQYFPAVTVDGLTLIYTARKGQGAYGDEDLVISHFKEDHWTESKSISDQINSYYNEGASTISADGRTLIFTSCEEEISIGSCDLFIARRTGENWSKPRNLGAIVNSIYWDSQPSLSADGKTLFFSSNRPGGQGGRDIWITYSKNDSWLPPVNAGEQVNTPKEEVTPFIHFNNRSLFFSSNGHVGFGGYDLYQSQVIDSFPGIPQNLGYGINDHLDQVSLVLLSEGDRGYFAKDVKKPNGTMSSKLAEVFFENGPIIEKQAQFVYGYILDAETKKPIAGTIELNNLDNSERTYQTASDPVDGSFYFVLPEGKTYGVWVEKKGYLFEDFVFDTETGVSAKLDTLFISLQPIKMGAKLILENIYFEFDSYSLNRSSLSELRLIAQYLNNNSIRVEISGHTDKVGAENYNLQLSESRAKTVYDYLISEGVNPLKLAYVGYGSSVQLEKNPSKTHLNRRIEFRIISENSDN